MDKETVNKLIINSLIKKGYKLEEVDQDFLNDMAEIILKQLALCNVSNRRELLEAFAKQIKEDNELTEEINFQDINKFLNYKENEKRKKEHRRSNNRGIEQNQC